MRGSHAWRYRLQEQWDIKQSERASDREHRQHGGPDRISDLFPDHYALAHTEVSGVRYRRAGLLKNFAAEDSDLETVRAYPALTTRVDIHFTSHHMRSAARFERLLPYRFQQTCQ